ncbi:YkuS family protein [Senegalia massiliensis]|uniref:YkuS family protein n=1 Tax=Senegalia massiliensis TaxID=1720316 RepID=UPI0010306F41|nr:YkuS family protein [Senegalia massiliensis]
MKRVSIQDGLNELAYELKKRGYEIVDHDSDAYIYMADGYDISNLTNMIDMNMGEDMNNSKGILLINASNKNIDQIEQILNKGYYTPLF